MGSALVSPIIGLGLSGIGTGMQMKGAYDEANAANQAAEYNAQLYERQASISAAQAADAKARGETEGKLIAMEGKRVQGAQRVGFAAAGINPDSGSGLDMQQNTAAWTAYNKEVAEKNGLKEAWGHEMQQGTALQQAAITRATKRDPKAAALAYGVSGATDMWRQYSNYKY